ncbi:MAG: hypothetical protein JOZ37_13465, partial [Actinobacteria bacterium]|nr:hypothetical protein [Actinomycetota bacterium]
MATMGVRLALLVAAALMAGLAAGCGRSTGAAGSGTYNVPAALKNYACPADANGVGAARS